MPNIAALGVCATGNHNRQLGAQRNIRARSRSKNGQGTRGSRGKRFQNHRDSAGEYQEHTERNHLRDRGGRGLRGHLRQQCCHK